MKRLALLLTLLLAGTAQADITTGLVGHWTHNDNAANTTVTATVGSNGVLTNNAANTTSSVSVAGPGGSLSTALDFDGVNDHVLATTGNAGVLRNRSAHTISMWVKTTTTAASTLMFVSTSSVATTRANITITATNGYVAAGARAGNGEGFQAKSTTTGVRDGAWHHVAVAYNLTGDTITIYVDGTAVSQSGTIEFTATSTDDNDSASVRWASGNDTAYFDGSIDDVRFYSRELPEADVDELYALGSATPPEITNSGTHSVTENTTAVATMVATGDTPITWSLSGGADEALFDIDVDTGALTFTAAPDFELPGDADTNNVYVVDVTATNAGGADEETQSITVTDWEPAEITGGLLGSPISGGPIQ